MTLEQQTTPITSFGHEPVTFVRTIPIAEGVECDVYNFANDGTKDLGIIRIKPGSKTPRQKILKGDKTFEGYVSGKGRFTITWADGGHKVYELGSAPRETFSALARVGDIMQWEAAPDSPLVAYEICFPPYEDGRFQNLT